MKKYVVVLAEDGEESICCRCDNIEAAKSYLESVRYYPEYSRSEECLDITSDGMNGYGCDATGKFKYTIKITEQ